MTLTYDVTYDELLAAKEDLVDQLENQAKRLLTASKSCKGLAAVAVIAPTVLLSTLPISPAVRGFSAFSFLSSAVIAHYGSKSARDAKRFEEKLYIEYKDLQELVAKNRGATHAGYLKHLEGKLQDRHTPRQQNQLVQQVVRDEEPWKEWKIEKIRLEAVFKTQGYPITIMEKEVKGDRIEFTFNPTGGWDEDKLFEGPVIDSLGKKIYFNCGYNSYQYPQQQKEHGARIFTSNGRFILSVKNPYPIPTLNLQPLGTPVTVQEREPEYVQAQQPQPQSQAFSLNDGPSFTITRPDYSQQQQYQPWGDHLRVMLGPGRADGQMRYWDLAKQANGFFLGLGASGSGKTETLKVLASEIQNYGIPVLITDFHGDIEIGGFKTITLSHAPTLPYGVNPLELDSLDPMDGGVYAQINIVLQMLATCIPGMGHRQQRLIKQALEQVYDQAGIKDRDPSTYKLPAPTFRDVIAVIEVMLTDEDLPSQDRNIAASSLAVIGKIFEHPIFNKPKQLSPHELSQGCYRLNMKHLEEHIKFVVADTMLRKASRYLRSQGHIPVQPQTDRERFRWFLMVDEAKVLSMGGANKDNPNAPLNKAATEDRKFGLGLGLFSQITDHFSKELLAQFAARLVMKPFDADEAKANATTIGVKPEDLMQLEGKGDGYLKLGGGQPADRISVTPTFSRPNYKPYVKEEEEVAEDPYETFDEQFEDKFGVDPDEIFEDEDETDDPWEDDQPTVPTSGNKPILDEKVLIETLAAWIKTVGKPTDEQLRQKCNELLAMEISDQVFTGIKWLLSQHGITY